MDSGEGATNDSSQQNQPNPDFDLPKYRMDHKERGVAIIISNKFQNHTRLKERRGADKDREKMYQLFRSMGFKKILGEKDKDYGVEEMKALFKQVSEEDFTNSDCFACAILSYGDKGNIYCKNEQGQNSEVEVDELLEFIKGKNCQSLAGKPKLCFIQTCPFDEKYKVSGDLESDTIRMDARKLPVEADFLKVHSCIPSDPGEGSLFIESLDKTIRSNWNDMKQHHKDNLDILTLMTRVSKDIAKKIDCMKKSDNPILKKKIEESKIPYVSSTLTKEMFFTEN